MLSFKRSFFLLLILVFPCLTLAQSDQYSVVSTSYFDTGLGASLEYTTPQKYGSAINLTFGNKTKELVFREERIVREYTSFKGLNIEAGLYRGGYQFGLYYINVGSSMVGPAGARLGVIYLMNNSYSQVLKSSNLIGIEGELYAFYKFRVGILRSLDENRFIPSLGFGFRIGPSLYK